MGLLRKVFGSKQAPGEREAKFDTRSLFEGDKLAPSFGTLTSDTIKYIDQELKVVILGLTKKIGTISEEERTWEKIIETFSNYTPVKLDGQEHYNADSFKKSGSDWFKGSQAELHKGVANEVKGWFEKLISDADVINATKIDIDEMAQLVATTGKVVDKLNTNSSSSSSYREQSIVELGILRYPAVDNPHFKLYRIQLFAWADFQEGLATSSNDNGIRGVFQKRIYVPNSEILGNIRKEVLARAAAEAENDLF